MYNYRLHIFFVALLSVFLSANAFGAKPEKGLSFRSYEVSPDLRTSLRIPAANEIVFKDYLSLSFDVAIDTTKECFGYVCRMIVDGQNVDIVLSNPAGVAPFIGMASRNSEMIRIDLPHEDIASWNSINIELSVCADSITVAENSHRFTSLFSPAREHSAVILFGTNNQGLFSTSDVAPMSVRNIGISIKSGGQPKHFWALGYDNDEFVPDATGKMTALIRNPEWIVEHNSRWHKIKEFTSPEHIYGVIDDYAERVLLITSGKVTAYDLQSGTVRDYRFRQDIRIDAITNDFAVLPDGRLVYCDFETAEPVINAFDFDKSCWERSLNRTRHSKYLHHNTFYNSVDSSLIQLFGYGFHRYYNEMNRWEKGDSKVEKSVLPQIAPRYLSAVGVADSVAYIYGGKGNDKGIQELGISVYNDFYKLNLNDYSVRKLWNDPSTDLQVAASKLLISEDGKTFRALFYSPNTYKSSLQLKEYSIEDGSHTVLADEIPYSFLDVDSEAHLVYDAEASAYFAVIISKRVNGYVAEIYRINDPIIDLQTFMPVEDRQNWAWIIIAIAAAALAAYAVLLRKANRHKPETVSNDDILFSQKLFVEAPAKDAAGIYLTGGFKVVDRDGNDITSNFTPIMRQLLALIILYTRKHKGISNAELKDALWYNKSEESYYNNRGVNIRKIRLLLDTVGNAEIASANGYWYYGGDESLCDYLNYTRKFEEFAKDNINQEEIGELIAAAHSGALLPNMQFEWFDHFKAEYADAVISILSRIRDTTHDSMYPEMKIKLADAILVFDSLDEDSIRSKCKSLIELKRIGVAQNVFNVFVKEYKRLMGEDYKSSFNEFIK